MSYSPYASSIYLPRLTFINKVLLISCGSIFILQSILRAFFGIALEMHLGLSPLMLSHGHIYQILTFPMMQSDLMSFLFNGLLLWFIGSDLEQSWGSKTYLKFIVASLLGEAIVFLGLVYFVIPSQFGLHPLLGLNGITFALLLAYGIIYKDRVLTFMLIFPMKAKYFCMVIVGIELYMGLFSPHQMASWGHLGAFLSAYLFLRFYIYRRSSGNKRQASFSIIPKKAKNHLRLVDSEKDKEKKNSDSNFGNGPKMWQ